MLKQSKKLTGLAVALSLALVAPMASAVNMGVGVSLNSYGGGSGRYGVTLPLRFGAFTVEPGLSLDHSSLDTSYTPSSTSNRNYKSDDYTLETGVYRRKQVIPAVETYVGGRVGYTNSKYSYAYPNLPSSNSSSATSGYYLGPTLGAEYFFDKHFSLSLDVSLLYESTTQKRESSSNYSVEGNNQYNYQTRARLRFYF